MTNTTNHLRRAPLPGLLAAAAVLAGCTTMAPGRLSLGAPIAEARGTLFGPTGEHALPGGGTRLEFVQGSLGKETYMLDFDGSGRLVTSQQVLTERNLATITPGMTTDELRLRFGRPVWVFGVNHPRGQVWNYRFDGGDCVWYQVTIADGSQRVVDAGIGTDPICDGPNERD